MNFALVEDGIVVDIIQPYGDFTLEERFHPDLVAKCVVCDNNNVHLGSTYIDGKFTDPAPFEVPPPPVPGSIYRRQFFQQLAILKKITNDEALAAMRVGSIPTALQTIIDSQPTDKQFAYELMLSGAENLQREHPLMGVVMKAMKLSSDDFFRDASVLE